jgi:hypothetical protein
MPATYSILNGEIIESTRKPDIYSVLQDLPDNSQKLISPRDVRDAFLSTWSNATFKLTSSGGNEYIGVDSNNPDDRDIKKKILLGKRSVGNFNVMSDALINSSDSDIFFYNTKADNLLQDTTKITFLAGTASNLFTTAPFIQAKVENSIISLNIENPQSSINISSGINRVSINNIPFPTVFETQNNAADGKILKYTGVYPFGNLEWGDPIINSTQIGQPGSTTNIYGSNVYLNGYSLEFIEDRIVPQTIGGIEQGMSFSAGSFNGQNWPISEVLRNLIYPQIPPTVSLEVLNIDTNNKYAEVGQPVNLSFSYSITTYARDNSESVSQYFLRDNGVVNGGTWNIIGATGGPLVGTPGTVFSFSQSYVDTGSNLVGEPLDYGLLASILDTGILNPAVSTIGFDYVTVDSIVFVAPFLSGFSNILHDFSPLGLTTLLQDPLMDKIIDVNPGSGGVIEDELFSPTPAYIYFAHPYSGTEEVKYIKDPNGFIIHDYNNLPLSGFTFSSPVTPQSPLNYYGSYIFYRSINMTSYTSGGKFEFIF